MTTASGFQWREAVSRLAGKPVLQTWLLIALIAAATAAMYGSFLWNPTVFDDHNYFGAPRPPGYPSPIFSPDIRWLPLATYVWTDMLFGPQIVWLRLGNLLLHVATAAMLFLFLKALFEAVLPAGGAQAASRADWPGRATACAFFGALIFALHPAAVYAAAYLIQRTILMATLFTVITWYCFVRGVIGDRKSWLAVSVATYLVASFSKEHAITAPAVSFCMLLLLRPPSRELVKKMWWPFAAYLVVALYVVYVKMRESVIGHAPEPRTADMLAFLLAQYADFDPRQAFWLSMLTQSFLYFKYLLIWIMPSPAWMSVDMMEPFATRLVSWPFSAGMVAFIAWPLFGFWLLLQRGYKGLCGFAMLGPWLMFATELSSVRLQESFVIYRSYLWMPPALAVLPFLFKQATPRKTIFVLSALTFALLVPTWDRLVTFSSPYLLWNDAARLVKGKAVRPGVERIYHNRGLELLKMGRIPEALEDLDKAIALNPKMVLAINDRGAAYLQDGQYTKALKDFDRAIELAPGLGLSYLGRALTYKALGQPEIAKQEFISLCKRAPDMKVCIKPAAPDSGR